MMWLWVYLIIGCVFCGCDIARVAKKVVDEKGYEPVVVAVVVMVMSVICSPLWPVLLGMSLAKVRR
ncbi:hypothetical protein [Paenibacillus glucanolyticus]|uniref:hypothetical protein n=1 Tax=Paenibacillus glucanolyticus TaxID=59843 RepID=UPI00096FD654|nr:hypothetical protein [Paenibacillus glucanolyticus]OMF70500.1 hypothetical protein BK142_23795 [Paenibacillus glucanolyticus]